MKSSMLQFVASVLILLAALAPPSLAQSATSGAITGSALDPTGAVVVGAEITATNDATGDVRTAVSSSSGAFLFPLLSPGSYTLRASKAGFKELVRMGVLVTVTETVRANLQLQIGKVSESVTVTAEGELLKTEDSALGDVTNARAVLSLPLASRNYTQIIGLSPGVSSDVTNASALGRGTGSDAAGANGFSSHGASTNDNNYQVNGVEVNDLMGSGNLSGGVAVPNPDSIQEFKVQTGQYDASYGRNAGANVDLVTKTGGNQVHGSLFEFFRNEDLNANDYFRNLNQQPRGVFKQNQFGGSLGGHIVKDKLFYFGSYQGTRQRNGLAAGSCATGVLSPPLTDDRSRAGLGALFSGPTGGAIAADGSNISDQAFALLNLKLANGKFAIPTPQTVDPSSPLGFFGEGSSSFSQSCPFTENQFLVDADYLQSAKSSLSGSFLFSNTSTTSTLTTNGNTPGSGVPGSPSTTLNQYRVFSLIHRYSFSSNLINQASLGFHRLVGDLVQTAPFKYSDIGVTVPAFEDSFPNVGVTGSFQIGGNGQGVKLAQNAYNFSDAISWTRGRQSLHFGGGIERSQINQVGFHFIAGLGFPTYEQFLLGNANTGVDLAGLLDRYWRTWGGNLYAQDNIKITSKFTVNLGLRYERQGDLGDLLGRNSSFDPLQADHTGAGSQAGYVVASNFSGDLPPGVIRAPNEAATNGLGQNTWGPRVGFSWQMPGSDRVVLRGGYGIFYSRTTAQPILQELTSPPFGEFRQLAGVIPFANPFPPLPVLPSFPSYSLENCSISFDPACLFFVNISTNIKPPTIQQYSLETQVALAHNFALEIGYQGARGTKLMEERSFNQALLASVSNPVNGAIDNTFSNVTQRTPVPGISPFMFEVGSGGASWYNALAVSLNKRISKGLQFLASYTWSSSLGTSQNFATGTQLGGVAFGDQNNPRARYGWDQFVRPQRFILSWVYQFPAFDHRPLAMRKVLGGWSVAGVTTIQSGQRLTVTAANLPSVFGTDLNDRAPASAAGCGTSFVNSGTVQNKLSNYINKSCFDLGNFPVIGDDGVGTGFGNSGIGEVRGPDQNNWDLSLQKATGLTERVQLQFRSDFFNAFNHAQFSNPDLNLGENALSLFGVTLPNASFGTIQTTSTNPRILQFSLRLVF
jgi:hypothetical protein